MKIKCPPPGVYHGIPALVYHSWDAVSSTLLKNYAALPSTALAPYVPSDDVNVGSGVHGFTLQGYTGLHTECAIMPADCEGTSQKAKDARIVFASVNPNKTLLPPFYGKDKDGEKAKMMDVLMGVDKSYRSHPKTSEVLTGAQVEVSLVWVDIQSGCLCKARLDVFASNNIIWDLKKTRDLDRFQWQIKELFYEIQAGHYFNGALACGLDPVAFGFLPCEATFPFRVGCGYLDPDKLAAAQVNAERLIGLVKQSKETNNWPNYQIPAGIMNLDDVNPNDLVTIY